MASRLRTFVVQYHADLGMVYLTLLLGFHYIVIKDALTHFQPLTFNAIRFTLGAMVFMAVALRRPTVLRIEWRDLRFLVVMSIVALAGFQVLLVFSLERTTSTNVSLLNATMPTWVAAISIVIGAIALRRGLLIGLAVTFAGVTLVVLGRAGGAEVSFGGSDLTGGLMALTGAILLASFVIITNPLIEKYGGLTNAIYKHWTTWISLMILASPDLVTLRPSDFPLEIWPNLIYSGVFASVSGYLVSNYAIDKLGPTRFSTYMNFTPLVTAFAGVLLLSEPLTGTLIIGGLLTLGGVATVRHYIYARQERPAPTPVPQPAAASVGD